MTHTQVITGTAIVGIAVALIAAARKAHALPYIPPGEPQIPCVPDIQIPSHGDILASTNIYQLDDYYVLISWLYSQNYIDSSTYSSLYDTYVERFYQLTGR